MVFGTEFPHRTTRAMPFASRWAGQHFVPAGVQNEKGHTSIVSLLTLLQSDSGARKRKPYRLPLVASRASLEIVELRLVGNDTELFFVRLQNFLKPAKTAGKSLAGLLRAAFLGEEAVFYFSCEFPADELSGARKYGEWHGGWPRRGVPVQDGRLAVKHILRVRPFVLPDTFYTQS